MSNDSNAAPQKLGDRIRNIARQLRQEEQVQIQATSRILGAAAQLAQNNDRLVDEVVEVVTEDLDQAALTTRYTVDGLKQQFKSFKAAKLHFELKASGWEALVDKLNASETYRATSASTAPASSAPPPDTPSAIAQRLDAIEQDLRAMRADLSRVLQLLES